MIAATPLLSQFESASLIEAPERLTAPCRTAWFPASSGNSGRRREDGDPGRRGADARLRPVVKGPVPVPDLPPTAENPLAEQSAVPMIVLTRHQDNVEAINSTLRNAGHAVRCNWIRELNDLGDALSQINAHMLVAFVGPDPADTAKVMTVCKQFGADVPVLIARDQVDEEIIAAAMQQGARDVVTLKHPGRLQAVVARELEAHRQARALNSTISSAREYRDQLKSFMAGSADAIAHVQEGIVVDANPAWLELYGFSDARRARRHAADGRLRCRCACRDQGRAGRVPAGQVVRSRAARERACWATARRVPLEMELSRTEFDGEPAVRLCIAAKKRDGGNLNEQLTDALERDAATGALQRRFFIERLKQSLAQPIKAGVRQLVSIEPDKLERDLRRPGSARGRRIHRSVRRSRRARRASPAICSAASATARLMLLMERGTPRDIETWANNLIRKVAEPGVSRRRQADLVHLQRRHRHDRSALARRRDVDQRCDRSATHALRKAAADASRSSTIRTRTRGSRPPMRSGCATSRRR